MTKIIKCLADVQIVQIAEKSCPISYFPRTKKGSVCVPVYCQSLSEFKGFSLEGKLANVQLSQVAWATTDPNDTCWEGGLFHYCINVFFSILTMVTNSLNQPLQTEWVSSELPYNVA